MPHSRTVSRSSSSAGAVELSPSEVARQTQRRRTSLFGAFLVALCAGSNYGFSSYAPQLQEQLHLSSTQINVVGVAGNMGVYLSGPVWGKWIDKRGPRSGLVVGAILVLLGYGGLSMAYSKIGILRNASPSMLAVLNLMTGFGNSGAFCASMNSTAKSWGEAKRGTATAIVLSGFGLSAFMWATLSHSLFPGQTGAYLTLLGVGSATLFLAGLLTIRICPPTHVSHASSTRTADDGRGAYGAVGEVEADAEAQHSPRMPKLGRRRTSSDVAARAWAHTPLTDESDSAASATETEDEEGALGGHSHRRVSSEALERGEAGRVSHKERADSVDISGWALFKQPDFLLLFLVMTLISGTGLLVINNIGTITRTLWEYNHQPAPTAQPSVPVTLTSPLAPELGVAKVAHDAVSLLLRRGAYFELESLSPEDRNKVQQLQAHQVSAISISNASGRIIVGFLSDLLVRRTGTPRSRAWMLMLVCALGVSSQAIAAAANVITTVDKLLAVSILTGLCYGSLMCLGPNLVADGFGLRNFSENWGYMSLSPVIAGNVFNLLFGLVYDSHVPTTGHEHVCPLGEECYRTVFKVTEVCSVLATVVSLVLIFRRAGVPRFLSGLLG